MIKLKDLLKETMKDKRADAETSDELERPISSAFSVKSKFDNYIKKFVGKKFTDEEKKYMESEQTNSFLVYKIKPSVSSFFDCRWEWTNDDQTTNYKIVIKKLLQPKIKKVSYVSFFTTKKIEVEGEKDIEGLAEAGLPIPPSDDKPEDKPTGTPPPANKKAVAPPEPKEDPKKKEEEEKAKAEEEAAKEKEELEKKKEAELDTIKISISMPFEMDREGTEDTNVASDINILKSFIKKLNIGKTI